MEQYCESIQQQRELFKELRQNNKMKKCLMFEEAKEKWSKFQYIKKSKSVADCHSSSLYKFPQKITKIQTKIEKQPNLSFSLGGNLPPLSRLSSVSSCYSLNSNSSFSIADQVEKYAELVKQQELEMKYLEQQQISNQIERNRLIRELQQKQRQKRIKMQKNAKNIKSAKIQFRKVEFENLQTKQENPYKALDSQHDTLNRWIAHGEDMIE